MPTKYTRKKFLSMMHLMLQIIEQFIVAGKCRNLFLKSRNFCFLNGNKRNYIHEISKSIETCL